MLTTRNLALAVAALVLVIHAAQAIKTKDVKSMSVTVECPDGWNVSASTGSCLKYSDYMTSWTEARADCQRQGGDLVKIANQDINDLVASLGRGQFFIGLYDRLTFKKWVWTVDHTEPQDYINWMDGRPQNRMLYRVALMDSGSKRWFDMSGYRGSRFMCEIFP